MKTLRDHTPFFSRVAATSPSRAGGRRWVVYRAGGRDWQSEYLQFTLFIFATVWFVQKGSPESKKTDEVGTQSDAEQLVGEHARPDSPKWARARGFKCGCTRTRC